MDQEILETLIEIRATLFLMAGFVGVGVIAWVLKSTTILIKDFQIALRQDWDNWAWRLFERGKYDELLSLCEKRLRKYPDAVLPIWWKARVNQRLGRHQEAQALFKEVVRLDPSWEEKHVLPYIQEPAADRPLKPAP